MTIDTGTDIQADLGTSDGDDAGAKERAQQAASTAADETKHVAGVAAGEAKSVAAEAADHARNLVGDARTQLQGQVEEQTRAQKDVLTRTLGTFGDDLASMAQDNSGLAADVAHEVADRARALSSQLGSKEPMELLDDVRRFARQRPGAFLLGALAAGVVVGRLARGTKDAIEAVDGDPSSAGSATGNATPPPATEYSSALIPPTGAGLSNSPISEPEHEPGQVL